MLSPISVELLAPVTKQLFCHNQFTCYAYVLYVDFVCKYHCILYPVSYRTCNMIVFILLTSIFLLVLWTLLRKENDALISGVPNPSLHPIFGNVKDLQSDPIYHFALELLTSKLGPVFKLRLFGEWQVFVTGFEEQKVYKS